jgi:putative transposase
MERKPYPSDLTDEQWKVIEPMIPPEKWGGRTRGVDMREVINGILYLTRTGCQWRAIPNDLPNRSTIRHYYDRFRADGTWAKLHDTLRERVRVAAAKQPTPSAAVIDSQSVKTTEKRGSAAGTMPARRSAGVSVTSRWTRWA